MSKHTNVFNIILTPCHPPRLIRREEEEPSQHYIVQMFCIILTPFHPQAGVGTGLRQHYPVQGSPQTTAGSQTVLITKAKVNNYTVKSSYRHIQHIIIETP